MKQFCSQDPSLLLVYNGADNLPIQMCESQGKTEKTQTLLFIGD